MVKRITAFFRRNIQSALVRVLDSRFWFHPSVRRKKNMEDTMKRVLTLIMVLAFLCAGTALFAGGQEEAEPSSLGEMTGADATSFTKFAVEEGATIVFSG